MNKASFETSSRKLEQFLYLHDIPHQYWYKTPDNMTVWVYPNTPEVRQVVNEFREIIIRRNERKKENDQR